LPRLPFVVFFFFFFFFFSWGTLGGEMDGGGTFSDEAALRRARQQPSVTTDDEQVRRSSPGGGGGGQSRAQAEESETFSETETEETGTDTLGRTMTMPRGASMLAGARSEADALAALMIARSSPTLPRNKTQQQKQKTAKKGGTVGSSHSNSSGSPSVRFAEEHTILSSDMSDASDPRSRSEEDREEENVSSPSSGSGSRGKQRHRRSRAKGSSTAAAERGAGGAKRPPRPERPGALGGHNTRSTSSLERKRKGKKPLKKESSRQLRKSKTLDTLPRVDDAKSRGKSAVSDGDENGSDDDGDGDEYDTLGAGRTARPKLRSQQANAPRSAPTTPTAKINHSHSHSHSNRPRLGRSASPKRATSPTIPRRSPEPVVSLLRFDGDETQQKKKWSSGNTARSRADSSTMLVGKTGAVRGATVVQLLDYVLARVGEPMVTPFLSSFPHFIDPTVVWMLVMDRYHSSQQRAAVEFVRRWIAVGLYRDFLLPQHREAQNSRWGARKPSWEDPADVTGGSLYQRLVEFLDDCITADSREIKLLVLRTAHARRQRLRSDRNNPKGAKVSKNAAAASLTRTASRFFRGEDRANTTYTFTNDVEPRVWAEQFTLIESEMFARIEATEFFQLAWKQPDKEELAPNICAMVQRFNEVSYWAATKIVMANNLHDRVKVIKKLVAMAEECVHIGNYNTTMEILGGINTWAIQRLKQTWEAIPARVVKKLEDLDSLMDSRHNYRAYRQSLASHEVALPYLGVYLRDLTFIGEGNTDLLGTHQPAIVNFEKMLLMGAVVEDATSYQRKMFSFPQPVAQSQEAAAKYATSIKQLRAYLLEVYGLREELLYKHSLFCEPSEEYNNSGGSAKNRSGGKSKSEGGSLEKLLNKGIRGEITDLLEMKVLKSMLLNHSAKDVDQAQETAHRQAGKSSPLDISGAALKVSTYQVSLRSAATSVNREPVEFDVAVANNTGFRVKFHFVGQSAVLTPEHLVAVIPNSGVIEKGKVASLKVRAIAFRDTKVAHVFQIVAKVDLPHDTDSRVEGKSRRAWESNVFFPVRFHAPIPAHTCPAFWDIDVADLHEIRPADSTSFLLVRGNEASQVVFASFWGVDVLVKKFAYERGGRPPSAFRKELETATWEKQHNSIANFLGAFARDGVAYLVFVREGPGSASEGGGAIPAISGVNPGFGASAERVEALQTKVRALKTKLAHVELENGRLRVYRSQAKQLRAENKVLRNEVKQTRERSLSIDRSGPDADRSIDHPSMPVALMFTSSDESSSSSSSESFISDEEEEGEGEEGEEEEETGGVEESGEKTMQNHPAIERLATSVDLGRSSQELNIVDGELVPAYKAPPVPVHRRTGSAGSGGGPSSLGSQDSPKRHLSSNQKPLQPPRGAGSSSPRRRRHAPRSNSPQRRFTAPLNDDAGGFESP
jgi:RasGEF domain